MMPRSKSSKGRNICDIVLLKIKSEREYIFYEFYYVRLIRGKKEQTKTTTIA